MEFGPGPDGNAAPILFTENSTNFQRLYGVKNSARFTKDAFHDYIIEGRYLFEVDVEHCHVHISILVVTLIQSMLEFPQFLLKGT